ncbi:MAG: M56 family metallopeptidase, partial [Ginsengibacter sp.]
IYETINVFYKTATSGFKNKVSTLLMFIAFAWFIGTLISNLSVDAKELASASSSLAAGISLQQTSLNGFTMQRIISYASDVLPYLSVSYIFLLLFLMVKLFSAYRYVYFIANKKLIVPPLRLQDFTTKVARKMTIARNVKVWLSEYVDVPATIGFIKPVILIPVASLNNLSSDQLEAIILHELSHIRRNDYLVNLFISVIETILFFNPFILLLSKALKRERENCCDDFVIQYRYDPHSYASALLSLEQSRKSNLQLSVAAVSGKKQLLMRIKRITNNKAASNQFNYGQKLFALLVITGIIFSIGWLSPQPKERSGTRQEAKVIEKKISPTEVIRHKKEEFAELSHIQVDITPRKNLLAKGSKSSVSLFKNIAPKPADPEDKDLASFDWKDFENNTVKLSEQALQNTRVFNIPKAKFAPFKANSIFRFPKLNVNIDVADLNKNLLQAYKEINALDWTQIQSDINESLSNIDIEHLNKARKKELLEQKTRYAEIMRLQKRQVNRAKDFLPQPRRDFFVNDSSHVSGTGWADKDVSTRQSYQTEITDQPQRNGNYNFVYVPAHGAEVKNTLRQNSVAGKAFTVTGLNNKSIKVIIENINEAFKDGNACLNFSTSSPSSDKNKVKKRSKKLSASK